MEPVNYRDALRRRWPVVVVIALVGAVIAVLFPVSAPAGRTEYAAPILIGVTPGSKGHTTINKIKFYAANQQIIVNAAHAARIKGKPSSLVKDVTFPTSKKKKKGKTPSGALLVAVKQSTASRSARLTNAFEKALASYIDAQLVATHQADVRITEQKISNLSNQIQNLGDEITALQPTTTTTTKPPPTTTTTTTKPPKVTTTTAATTTTTVAGTAFRVPAGGTGRVLLTASSGSDLAQLKLQLGVDTKAYQSAQTTLLTLKENPVPQSGIIVLQPALARLATVTKVKSSILAHRSVRGLIGLVAGALIGVIVIFGLDALDKRLRTTTRTQETLGYPVLAEIPTSSPPRSALHRRREEAPVVFATFTEPGSAVAEAYRMLRTAVLLEPIFRPGDGMDHADTSGSDPSAPTPDANDLAAGARAIAPVPPPGLVLERRARQVVLVVSAGVEPTRALVVTNLAAAFAEAGEQALIVTTADLRERDRVQDTLVVAPVGTDPTAASITEATRPTGIAGVRSLAFSSVIEGPGQLATRSAGVLSAARQVADVIIVDAPLLAVHDAEALVPAVDVVVVVVESWWTRVDQATRSGVFLRRIAAPVLGAVLTEVQLGKKDLRRVIEPERRRDARDEDEDLLVRPSRPSAFRRRRGRDAEAFEP
jgi:Mrp family chromosome partitioning ATPase